MATRLVCVLISVTWSVLLFNGLKACAQKKVPKYLVMNYFNLPQSFLEATFINFSRKRDYYRTADHQVNSFGPIFLSFKALADHLNSTLITDNYYQQVNPPTELNLTQIYPAVWTFPGAPYSISGVLEKHSFLGGNSSDISIIADPAIDMNFVYCDIPKLKKEKPWNIGTLIFSFQNSVWFVFLLSALVLNIFLHIKFYNQANNSDIAFSILGLVLPGALKLSNKFIYTPLFYLWSLCCLVVCNHYTAIITSSLISPSEEEALSYLPELFENGFELMFESLVGLTLINASVQHVVAGNHSTSNQDQITLYKMLENLNPKYIFKDELHKDTDYLIGPRILANNRGTVSVALWNFVTELIYNVNSLFDKNISPQQRPVHCYLGKRLIPLGVLYQIFVPPGGIHIGKIAQKLTESGIYTYWREEYIQLRHSARVQDRSRVISPTKILYDFEQATTAPLGLEGKISSVFFVCFVCLIFSFLVFILEQLRYKYGW